MDILMNPSAPRNGLEDSYYSFLGIGTGSAEAKKIAASLNAEMAGKYPLADTSSGQDVIIAEAQKVLDQFKADKAKAKSKKTKNTIQARIDVYEAHISSLKSYRDELVRLEKQEADRIAAAEAAAAAAAAASPTSVITPGTGQVQEVVLGTGDMQQAPPSPVESEKSDSILGSIMSVLPGVSDAKKSDAAKTSGTPGAAAAPAKKSNTLLYVGLAVAAVIGFLLLRKKKQ